jgi:hypothetical protein
LIKEAVCSPPASLMSPPITLAPSAANIVAHAQPIPEPAPVTIAIFPDNLIKQYLQNIHNKLGTKIKPRTAYMK